MSVRNRVQERFQTVVDSGSPLVGVATGSGIAAKHALAGGADFLMVPNAGRFRAAGVPSPAAFMPVANANRMALDCASKEILPRASGHPVFVSACATEPCLDVEGLIEEIIDLGFQGVNNFPSVGFVDGRFREVLEKSGFTFQREIDFLVKANKAGLFTLAFAFNIEEAKQLASSGVDAVCINLGLTPEHSAQAAPESALDESVKFLNQIFAAMDEISGTRLKFFYGGGPITTPSEMEKVFLASHGHGYVGGSVFERIPTAAAVEEITGQFKNIIQLRRENATLRNELIKKKGFDEIVGRSRSMQELFDIVSKVADKDINVLVSGESGTGKELVVKAIHFNSPRFAKPFIKVNCAAIPEALLESELFGHAKGAFTGAVDERVGLFELADNGTLFLDEIGEMSLATQAKLLRAIQQREFNRVGSNRLIKVNIRIVAATNVDLAQSVMMGKFREDLFYRLNVITIHTPALRHHREDIPLLAAYFLRENAKKFSHPECRLTPQALQALNDYSWPGNVRELEHALESASILCADRTINLKDLPVSIQLGGTKVPVPAQQPVVSNNAYPQGTERERIVSALQRFEWHRGKAAQFLGITRRTLFNKIKKYRLSPEGV